MSKEEIIERLGALLVRVRTRATRSRTTLAGGGEPSVEATSPKEVFVGLDVGEAEVPGALPRSALDDTAHRDPDSEERLVAAELRRDRPEAIHESTQRELVSDSLPDALASDFDELDVVAEVEQAPISSRRPVAPDPEQRLAELAFGAQEPQAPRHTPPPESGQLLAMPEVEFDGDITGVRDSLPVLPNRSDEAAAVQVPAQPFNENSVRPRGLVPEEIRPQIATSERVMDILGEAQTFAPPTFLALVEASLRL